MTRRIRATRGQGTIEEVSSGTWAWRRSTVVNGERRRQRDYFNSRQEAEWAQAQAVPLSAGDVLTVGEWCTRWVTARGITLRANGRDAHYDHLESNIRLYIVTLLGDHRLTALKPSHCDAAWVAMINGDGFARPLARKTATNARSVLRQALKAAERDELVVRNVAALSDLPALHQGDDSDTAGISEEEILSPTDVNRLIEWLHAAHKAGSVWALPTIVAVATGARRGEVAGLQRTSLGPDTLAIMRQYARLRRKGKRQYRMQWLKTGPSRRIISIDPELTHLLRTDRKGQTVAAFDGHMFTDGRGEPLNPDSWTNWWAKLVRPALGFNDEITLHSLRHTHASLLLAAGMHDHQVARRLGHSSSIVTRTIYTHALEADDHLLVDAWRAVLNPPSSTVTAN